MKISAIVWLLLLAFCASAGFAFPVGELSKDEAIALAENAILTNGCSDLTPIKDRPGMSADTGVGGQFRVDHELDCHAVRAFEGKVNGKLAWIIGFAPRHRPPEDIGYERLILMAKDGSNLRLENRKNRIVRILKENR